jgi:small conductance mechanosensitive channel
MLLALRPIRIGEYVEVGEVAGIVEEIGLFATRLSTLDGVYLLAPNSTLWNTPVRNYSRNVARRNDITVGIGYGDDIDLALRTLMEIATSDGRILADPAPMTFVTELGDSAVAVTLRYWTASTDFLSTKLDFTKAAKQSFDRKGISIPFPQRDVTLRQVTQPLPLEPAKPDQNQGEP